MLPRKSKTLNPQNKKPLPDINTSTSGDTPLFMNRQSQVKYQPYNKSLIQQNFEKRKSLVQLQNKESIKSSGQKSQQKKSKWENLSDDSSSDSSELQEIYKISQKNKNSQQKQQIKNNSSSSDESSSSENSNDSSSSSQKKINYKKKIIRNKKNNIQQHQKEQQIKNSQKNIKVIAQKKVVKQQLNSKDSLSESESLIQPQFKQKKNENPLQQIQPIKSSSSDEIPEKKPIKKQIKKVKTIQTNGQTVENTKVKKNVAANNQNKDNIKKLEKHKTPKKQKKDEDDLPRLVIEDPHQPTFPANQIELFTHGWPSDLTKEQIVDYINQKMFLMDIKMQEIQVGVYSIFIIIKKQGDLSEVLKKWINSGTTYNNKEISVNITKGDIDF